MVADNLHGAVERDGLRMETTAIGMAPLHRDGATERVAEPDLDVVAAATLGAPRQPRRRAAA
jgi:hypothetical protein